MGSILRFNLKTIREEFQTDFFFETGTWKGDAVEFASQFSFQRILSVEIVPELARNARSRFFFDPRVSILEGNSVAILKKEIAALEGNCVFWLDAHFPGADAGITEYDGELDETLRLPLPSEVTAIRQLRPERKDVFIIDDLRIYEDGPFENGNVPEDALPRNHRNLDFIEGFRKTHWILKSYRDEGYLVIVPRKDGMLVVTDEKEGGLIVA